MDHIIRLEKSKDNQQLDLQFTFYFEYGPFLCERSRHNWAFVTKLLWYSIYFFNLVENLAINQRSCLNHITRQGIIRMSHLHSSVRKVRESSFFKEIKSKRLFCLLDEIRAKAAVKVWLFVRSFENQLMACTYLVPWLFNPRWQWIICRMYGASVWMAARLKVTRAWETGEVVERLFRGSGGETLGLWTCQLSGVFRSVWRQVEDTFLCRHAESPHGLRLLSWSP